ncbi:RING finger protein, putative [Entamoeba invadens IP1]|uniref:RING finger protein, putative n=1 Tax=Entamoeba invadens IP1 TaxID=370355 RepID=A0A0A1U442_ENTIV|nr:RING finger protein, putative [Entamoeba invadens IP1]ELP86456.1 RING finger protein, putative [Entamoeba invadens IP1]|eukprot:XP_004185802.1 RING finger protein, putative [Entamoeba invadens IP1]
MNQIFPNCLTRTSVGEYVLTVPTQMEGVSAIPFSIIPTSKNIPRMYVNKNQTTIKYLPPTVIHITFDFNIPNFQITSLWLTVSELIKIKNTVEEALSVFDGRGLFVLLYETIDQSRPETLDIRLFPKAPLTREDRQQKLLQYNFDVTQKVFYSQDFVTCDVCYEECPPKDFVVFSSCGHFLCKNCLKSQLLVAISSGKFMLCPYAECKEEILPWELESVCVREDIIKYEKQLAVMSIQSSGDYIVCPFCNYTGILVDPIVHKKSTPIICANCEKTFCSVCLCTNHVGTCYDVLSLDRFKSESYYTELVGELSIKNMKKCPLCKCPVLKAYGCNHINCTCGCEFCYNCGKRIHGYAHFNESGTKCVLYSEKTLMEDTMKSTDTRELDKLMKDPKMFPYFCNDCETLFGVEVNSLVIRCPFCKKMKCRHCGDENVSKEHLLRVLQLPKFKDMKIPDFL